MTGPLGQVIGLQGCGFRPEARARHGGRSRWARWWPVIRRPPHASLRAEQGGGEQSADPPEPGTGDGVRGMRPTGFCGPSVPPRPVAPAGRRRPAKLQRKACAAAAGRIREPRRRPSLRRSASPSSPLPGGRCEPAYCPAMIGSGFAAACPLTPALPYSCPRPLRRPGMWCTVRRVQPDAESRGSAPTPPRLGPWEPPERRGDVRARAPSIASDASPRLVRRRLAFDQISAPGTARAVTRAPLEDPCRTARTLSAAGICLADRDSDSRLDPRGRGCPGVPCMRTGVLLSACNPPVCSRWPRVTYGG